MNDHAGTAEKNPIEQAVDVLVYAPIGLLFEGSTILPQLVEKGRNQVSMARVVGRFAVEQGRVEATKTATKLGDQAAGLLDFLGDSLTPSQAEPAPVASPDAAPAKGKARNRARTRPVSNGRAAAAAKTSAKVARSTSGAPAPAPARTRSGASRTKASQAPKAGKSRAATAPGSATTSTAELAIPDYDGLSASHVVNRLGGLAPEELESVRRYEAANRGRKTILSKISQLQSA